MNFHLQEVSVHNLGICYGALGIALVPVVPVFIYFSHAEKNAFVAVERCWSNTLKMIKTIELLPLLFFFFFCCYYYDKDNFMRTQCILTILFSLCLLWNILILIL